MPKLLAALRATLGCALLLAAGITCTDSTGVARGRAVVGLTPVFDQQAAAIYSNLVDGGLAIDNVRLRLTRGNGVIATDTVVAVDAQDTLIAIEATVDISGGAELLGARIDMRDGNTVLFSGEQSVLAVAGAIPTTPPQVTMSYEGPGAGAVAIDLAPADTAITETDSVVFRPGAKDKDSASVTDFALLWSVKDAARGTISEAGVFKPLPGRGSTYVIATTFTGLKDSALVTITPTATKLVVISGNGQTGTVGGNLPQQLVVESQAADNLPVPGVTATLIGPPGTVVVQSADKTDQNGRISFTVPVGTLAGPVEFSVTSPGLPTLNLTGTAVAAAPAKVQLTTRPSATVVSGGTFATQPVARIIDAFGNTVTTSSANVAVTAGGGHSIVGAAVKAASNGVATFSGLGVSGSAGLTLLTFASDGLASDTATVDVQNAFGAPASLVATSPLAFVDSIQANVTAANLAAVVVKDAQSVPVPGVAVKFHLFAGLGSQINATTGFVMVNTDANGVAKLSSQRLRDSIGIDSVFVTTATLTDTVKIFAGVLNGAPHHLAVLSEPTGADANQAFGLVVVLQDRLNNITVNLPDPPNVTVAIKSGTGAGGAILSPNPSALTQQAAAGVATFLVSIDLPAAGYVLTATTPAVPGTIETASFDISAVLPDEVSWVNAAGGNWSVASNWSTGVVPGAGDVVNIDLDGTYTVTLDVNASVKALNIGASTGTQTLAASSKTITITDASAVNANGVLSLTNSTITGAGGSYLNEGTVLAHGASAINVVFENAGLMRVQGQASGGNANLTFANGFANSADLQLTSVGGGYNSTLTVTSGTLVNTGSISALVGAGGSRTIAAQVDNQGTMTSDQNLNVSKADADHVNSGTIVVGGGDFTFSQTGTTPTFTNTGNIAINASRSFTVAGGEATFNAGTVTGPLNSYVLISNATVSFSTFTILVPLQLSGTSPVAGGAVTVASGQTLRLFGGTLSATLDVQAGGTLEWISNGSITGALINDGTIKVRGQAFGSNAALTVANGFTNNGTIEMTSQDGGYNSTLTVTNGTLVNSATGTIKTSAGAGGSRTLAAQLDNAGLLDVDAALTMNKAEADHTNSGTIDLTTANLTLTQTGTTPTFTNTGSVNLGANRTFTITGGSVVLGNETVSGTSTSTLAVNSATMDFTPEFGAIPLTLTGVTVASGSLTIPEARTLTLLNGGLTAPVTIQDGGTLRTLGSVSLKTVISDVNSMIQPRGQANGGNSTLTIENGFTNNGTIELISADGGYNSTLNVTDGALVNAAGGFIRTMPGAGGARTIGAALNNQGSFDAATATTIAAAGATHYNGGDVFVTSANLTITQSGGGASFTNAGNITLGTSKTLTITGGTVDLSAGTVTGPTTSRLAVGSATLAFSTSTVNVPMTLTSTGISGGSLTIPSGDTLTLWNGGLIDPVTINGTLLSHGTVSLTGTVSLPTGGVLRVRGQDGFNAALTIADGFTNNGLIELTNQGGGFNSTLVVTNNTLTNASGATIKIAGSGGTRTLGAQLDNQGTLDVDVALLLSKAGAAHTNSGAIDLTGAADLTVTQSGTEPSFTNTGTITLGASRDLIVNGTGTLNLSAGTVSGQLSSTLFVTGQTMSFSTTTVTIPMTLTTTTTGGTITIPSGQTLTLRNGGLSDPVTISGTLLTLGNVSLAGSVTLNAGGTLLPRGQDGFNSVLTIADGFTNNGLIELANQGGGYNSTLNVTNNTLTNAAGGVIRTSGSGGLRSLGAQLNNQGIVDVDVALTLSKTEADHTNSGTIDATVADFQVSQSGLTPTFSQSAAGTITLAANRSVTFNGGTVDVSNGTVTGTTSSRFIANGATLNFTPNTIGVPMTLTSTLISGGSVTIGTSQTITLIGGGLSDPVTINSGGTLLTHQTVSLTGAMTLNSGGNLRVRGQDGFNASLTIADGFTNSGLIELTNQGGGYNATLAVTNGTLTNASGGLIASTGSGGTRTLAADISNNGTIDVDAALILNKADATHYNANTIDLTNANLTVTQTAAGTFGNGIAGIITLGANRDLIINGGTANFTGASIVQGQPSSTLTMSGATLNFTPAHVTVPLVLSTTTIQGGTVTVANSQTVTLLGGTLAAATTVQNGGVLLAYRTAAANSVTVDDGGSLQVVGQGGFNAQFTVDNGVTNNGQVELTNSGGGYNSTLVVTNGAFTNGSTGTLMSTGSGGTRTFAAQLENYGTLDIDYALTINKPDAAHFNAGYIDLTQANLTVTQTGTSPSFANHGTIQLATGRKMTVAGGALTNLTGDPSGTIQGPGTLDVSAAGTTFTNFANLNPGIGTLNITGSYTQNAVNGGTLLDMGNTGCTSHGVIAATGTVTLDGTLTVSLNDCLPVLNNEFTIMTFGSRGATTFSQVNLPTIAGLTFDVIYGATDIKLKVINIP